MTTNTALDLTLLNVLDESVPGIATVILFGSLARGTARPDSDLDIAVDIGRPLAMEEKIALIDALALSTGRPIDLVDLRVIGEPLLGQVLRHGRRLRASERAWGELYARHVYESTDFLPYRNRILAERRIAWIGK